MARSSSLKYLLRGKRVLITGASKGIGEQIAYEYARYGASVFLTARKDTELQNVMNKCKEIGSSSAISGYYAMDMMQPGLAQDLVEFAVSTLGGLDVIILNHAYIPKWEQFTSSQHSLNVIERTMRVNVLGSVSVMAHAIPHLTKTQGAIGVVSSVAGKIPSPYMASYAASKFALDGFFGSLREEILHTNITITNCVLGLIGTGTVKNHLQDLSKDFNLDLTEIVQGPWAPLKPEDSAEAIVRGVALRKREIYFPDMIRYLVYIREFLIQFNLYPGMSNDQHYE